MGAKGTPALEVVRRAGIEHRVHEYEIEAPDARRARAGRASTEPATYGEVAAVALGVAPDRVFKTLVALVDGTLAAAIVPVDAELDLKRFAAARGGRRAEIAPPADAERATGYVIGGISPLGQRRQLPSILDASAADHATIFVSAGRRGLQLELAPTALAELAGASMVPIARVRDTD
jgi:Cys-tRNA(Pro)/Cys-tRNA(Cys) deacylase